MASCEAVDTASKPIIGEEHDGGAAQNTAPPEKSGPLVWRDEGTVWIACRHPVLRADESNARHDKGNHDRHLDDDYDVVDPTRFTNADDEEGRDRHDDEHSRNVKDGARAAPDAGCRIIGKWRGRKLVRDRDAKVAQKTHDVARPADGNRRCAKRILKDQVPADDPGDEFAQGSIGIGVGTPGDRDGGGHLRVAKTRKRTSNATKYEGERNGGIGVGGCGMAGEHENARADDAADTKRNEAPR